MEKIKLVVGFDQREAVAYHAFCQSVLEKSSLPVMFLPLASNALPGYQETHKDASNAFVYSRFLTPWLNDFAEWAVFADGDMICLKDIKTLWDLRDNTKAVQVIKHEYQTKAPIKYFGNKNENYPRKNWSSLILWNCGHSKNKILTPDFVKNKPGSYLHRFSWLDDEEIGSLPLEWNWLTTEYEDNYAASLLHYTLGTPCLKDYQAAPMADEWRACYARMIQGVDA